MFIKYLSKNNNTLCNFIYLPCSYIYTFVYVYNINLPLYVNNILRGANNYQKSVHRILSIIRQVISPSMINLPLNSIYIDIGLAFKILP